MKHKISQASEFANTQEKEQLLSNKLADEVNQGMTKAMLKPEQVKIIGDIENLNANLLISMTYANWLEKEIDAEFNFPVDPDVIVTGLTVKKQ